MMKTPGGREHRGQTACGALPSRTLYYGSRQGTPYKRSVAGRSARSERALRRAPGFDEVVGRGGGGKRSSSSAGTADADSRPFRWIPPKWTPLTPSVSCIQSVKRRKYGSSEGARVNKVEQPGSSCGLNARALQGIKIL